MGYDEFLEFVVSRLKVHPAMTYFMTDDEMQECDEILNAVDRLQKCRKKGEWWDRKYCYAAQAMTDINIFRFGYTKKKA